MTPSPSRRVLTPRLDELLPTTRWPTLDPSVPLPPSAPVPVAPPATPEPSPRTTSSSWDLKPGRWIKALPASYRTRTRRARFSEWARDEAAVSGTIGAACAAVGLALVIGALVYGAIGLSRGGLAGASPSVAIAMVAGRVAMSLLAIVSGHRLMKLAERILSRGRCSARP